MVPDCLTGGVSVSGQPLFFDGIADEAARGIDTFSRFMPR
jgi:hypothetical protein